MHQLRHSSGFTLVEMVMVIVIASILAVGSTMFISYSVGGYVDSARRQELVTIGLTAAEKIGREVRNALPNSIRITAADNCLEFIPIVAGSTYVSVPIASAASTFDAAPMGAAAAVNQRHVVVYPINTAALYNPVSPGPITPGRGSLPAGSTQVAVTLAAPHQFLTDSPTRRFFMVDPPVAYCQVGTQLFRYQNYGFVPNIVNLAAALPTTVPDRQLVADQLRAGSLVWDFTPASLVRNAVLRLSFDLVDPQAALEVLPIEHEVQVRNVP